MLILPEGMRETVRQPFGKVVAGGAAIEAARDAPRPLISVGDQCAYDLISAGIQPDMMVMDFKIRRVEIPPEMKQVIAKNAKNAFVVLSGPGQITDQLQQAVERMLSEGKGAVFVAGEDDLSSLLVMARAREGTLVYGQPDSGAVFVPLGSKELRDKVQGILDRMPRA